MGGKNTGPNPTDRAKRGTKRSVVTDAKGIPLGLAVGGANVNDHKLLRETLESVPVEPVGAAAKRRQHMCLDKAYDNQEVRELLIEFSFTAHIRSRGDEAKAIKKSARTKARRWVVERTHGWLNRFRGILTRWAKRADTYVALLHFAFAIITWRAADLLG